jgi:hypothetical protein
VGLIVEAAERRFRAFIPVRIGLPYRSPRGEPALKNRSEGRTHDSTAFQQFHKNQNPWNVFAETT